MGDDAVVVFRGAEVEGYIPTFYDEHKQAFSSLPIMGKGGGYGEPGVTSAKLLDTLAGCVVRRVSKSAAERVEGCR